mgnify:CR=1 FL=1
MVQFLRVMETKMSKTIPPNDSESNSLSKPSMTKEDLLKHIQRVLETDLDLNFLLRLDAPELSTLLVSIRDRLSKE